MCKSSQIESKTEQNANGAKTVYLEPFFCFPSSIHHIGLLEFLDVARTVSMESLSVRKKEVKKLNEIYPVIMTDSLNYDSRMLDMANTIAQMAWNILSSQGYAMQNLSTYFTEFWCQEHHKHSAMEQHVHGGNSQIVGFYFIDVPKDSSRVLFHDPRAGKVQVGLPDADVSQITPASNIINFVPEPGMCMFANSWLPHSFTRHAASKPMRFIHFNISVRENAAPMACPATEVEVI